MLTPYVRDIKWSCISIALRETVKLANGHLSRKPTIHSSGLLDRRGLAAYARVFINSRTRSAIWSALVSSAKCPASSTITFASGTSAR